MAGRVVSIPIPGEFSVPWRREPAGLGLDCYICGSENRLAEYILNRILVRTIPSRTPEPQRPEAVSGDRSMGTWLDPMGASPILFYGPTGCGKTHIARGLWVQWRTRFGQDEAIYTSAVDLARTLASTEDASVRQAVLESFCRPSLVVLDDIDQLSNRHASHGDLQRLIDGIADRGGLLIATSTAVPECIFSLPPAVRSRLSQGCIVPLALPGQATRHVLARQLAARRNIVLTERELAAVTGSFDASPRSIIRRLQRMEFTRNNRIHSEHANSSGDWDDPLEQLDDPLQPMLPTITATTARYFKLTTSELRGPSRRHTIVHARGIAMYLARELTHSSLSTIGREFGNRDHSTVLHACRRIANMLSRDEATRTTVSNLSRILASA